MQSKTIDELTGVIGQDNALLLASQLPGMSVYIPLKAKDLPHVLALLGEEITQKLCDHFRGDYLTLPVRKDVQRIRNNWIVEQHQAGTKIDDLVRASGVSRRQIFNILRDHPQQVAA